jgi:hypothetical protein
LPTGGLALVNHSTFSLSAFIVLLPTLAGVKDDALGEEVVEEIIKQADGFAFGFYVPHQEPVVKRRDQGFVIIHPEEAT